MTWQTFRSQEEGKAVPEDAVLRMKANFVLPDVTETFSEVLYTDLAPQAATILTKQYHGEAMSRGEMMNKGCKAFVRSESLQAQVARAARQRMAVQPIFDEFAFGALYCLGFCFMLQIFSGKILPLDLTV